MRVGCYGLYVAVGAQRFECLTNPGALLGAEFPVGVREVVIADSQQRKCAFDAFQVTRSVFSDGIDRCADLHDAALDFADAGDVMGACGVSGADGVITITNTKEESASVTMPATGGRGTRWYTITGAAILCGTAAGYLWFRRRYLNRVE